ncbi:MAG TPA: cellulose biosynthesis cyclic di-GMP-binding regulatory protein BcsB, partial [Candidatus Limiplasma sp.]|nr:cellulose biosynthesis cyclic di-GMP-binding regulatory protein BcsB [Candidatus Limiplasma sp.]
MNDTSKKTEQSASLTSGAKKLAEAELFGLGQAGQGKPAKDTKQKMGKRKVATLAELMKSGELDDPRKEKAGKNKKKSKQKKNQKKMKKNAVQRSDAPAPVTFKPVKDHEINLPLQPKKKPELTPPVPLYIPGDAAGDDNRLQTEHTFSPQEVEPAFSEAEYGVPEEKRFDGMQPSDTLLPLPVEANPDPTDSIPPQPQAKKPRRHSLLWVLLIVVLLGLVWAYAAGVFDGLLGGADPAQPTIAPVLPTVSSLRATPAPALPTATPANTARTTDPNTTKETDNDTYAATFDSGPPYVEYPFAAPRLMSGIYSTLGLYVSLPDYIQADSATLRVSYTCSDLILDAVSSLTFYVNDLPIYSCPVTYQPTGPVLLTIDVPVDMLSEPYNLIEIRGYSRLIDDENCMDEYAEANWIQFGEQTALRVEYTLLETPDSLSMFPYPYVSIADATGERLTVAIPDGIHESELEAALVLMASLGGETSDENAIQLATWSATADPRVIFVGLEENLPPAISQLIRGIEIPQDNSLLYAVSSGDTEYLLLIGKTPEALREAAQLMADPARVKQLTGDRHFVRSGASAAILEQAALSDTVVQNSYTLKDILGRGLSFTGPFHQEVSILLPTSSDYTLSGQSKFTFTIRYSDNLNFDRSLMTVYIGDVPIFSKKLTAEGAEGETVTFLPPTDIIGQPVSYMRVAFDLEMEDLDCTPRQLDTPWAHITEDSTFYLPQGSGTALSLSAIPSPFQSGGVFNRITAVIPDQPTDAELLLLGRTVAMLGAGCRP